MSIGADVNDKYTSKNTQQNWFPNSTTEIFAYRLDATAGRFEIPIYISNFLLAVLYVGYLSES